MPLSDFSYSTIKKLGHPLKEIRERSLLVLIAKAQLGLEPEDELAETRELLEKLLQWLQTQEHTLQKEAMEFLLATIKTKSGSYAAREYGLSQLLSHLHSLQSKLVDEAKYVYHDIIETLQFMHTVNIEENVCVPTLHLQSFSSNSNSEVGYNGNQISMESLQKSVGSSQQGQQKVTLLKVMLFPWAQLCVSDKKTLTLVEDALKLLKSTNRCCRFVQDVLVRDFPSEVFLNRPIIVKNLFRLVRENKSMSEALGALLYITRSLRNRLKQLTSPDLAHVPKTIPNVKVKSEEIHEELADIIGEIGKDWLPEVTSMMPLKQLPAPTYTLDCLHVILSAMTRSIIFGKETHNHGDIKLNTTELNICMELVEELIEFLQECVCEEFWQAEHNTTTYRDIAHKCCMAMRMLTDVLMKYSEFNSEDEQYRSIWLRLVSCAERLLSWSNGSNLPPTCFVNVISNARLDPALGLFYPELMTRLSTALQNGKFQDYEHKKMYKDLRKIYASMEATVVIFKDHNLCQTKSILEIIKHSLPAIGLHENSQFIKSVANIILKSVINWDLDDLDWNLVKDVALSLMSHKLVAVSEIFYECMLDILKEIFVDENQMVDDRSVTLFCDVGILTEICCHGLSSKSETVSSICNEILMLLLRGRLLVTERCWWRLLAAMLPIMPLLHAKADHDTPLGQAICKSLEVEIADCMGIPRSEVLLGLCRLLFVRCPTVQLDAALSLCSLIDDPKYLPPKETLRADVLISALRRVQPEDLNITTSTSANSIQTSGLLQVLDVLKQDLDLSDDSMGLGNDKAARLLCLEPSLRRSTLQQLAVLMQNADMHQQFVEYNGLKIIVALLRLSLLVDDYLAFPECAISCVSILNSVCYHSRHILAKVNDLPAFLIRVILIFPANESLVLMAAQVLSVLGWAGFVLQELNADHKRVLALPLSVVMNVSLPFPVETYWESSPNTKHSPLEFLQTVELSKKAIRVRWSYVWNGFPQLLYDPSSPPGSRSMVMTEEDQRLLQASCPLYSSCKALIALQNATSHRQVYRGIGLLENYCHLLLGSYVHLPDFASLPWYTTMARYLTAAPSSPKDVDLLIKILKLIITYLKVVPYSDETNLTSWIIKSFLESNNSMINLLSQNTLYPQQSVSESVEISHLHVHIVRVLSLCVINLEPETKFDPIKLESLVKILVVCLENVDLKNFHVLGYLNELVKCIRYITHSKHCILSPESIELCMRELSRVLRAGNSGGCKGQACRLDAMVTLLRLTNLAKTLQIPVQRWGDIWSGEVMCSVVQSGNGARAELRAAAIQLLANLSLYPQLLPQLLQAVPQGPLSKYAVMIFTERSEANLVRSAAANLITAVSSRLSTHTEVYENDILEQLKEHDFLDHCLEILVDFCKEKQHKPYIEPNVPINLLERYEELEVRASKADVHISPKMTFVTGNVSPTTELVVALVNTLHNVVVFNRCPLKFWSEKGLFRLLFRCSFWGDSNCDRSLEVRSSVCRTLSRVSALSSRVRVTLSSTKDCLLSLLSSLKHIALDYPESQQAVAQSLSLLAILLSESCVRDSIWMLLQQGDAEVFFDLLIQCLRTANKELQKATMYFLTQLLQSISNKKHDAQLTEEFLTILFDNVKSLHEPERLSLEESTGHYENCCPTYVNQVLCNELIRLFVNSSSDDTKTDMGQDDFWLNICSCLSSVMVRSARARLHATTMSDFHTILLGILSRICDYFSFADKPAQVIRNANNNPTLSTLQWILILTDCMMRDCIEAKNNMADNRMAVYLVKLWPYCMMTEPLREAVVHLLHTFSNGCPKGSAAMCTCVSGRSLLWYTCGVCVREAALLSRPHSCARLVTTLHTAANCISHGPALHLLLQTDVLSCIYKLQTCRCAGSVRAVWAWSRVAAALCTRGEGAARLLALRPLPHAALAGLPHAAHCRRAALLADGEVLKLICEALSSNIQNDVLCAARTVWVLAANNHRAKLTLRNAGISAAIRTALERYKLSQLDPDSERILQLLHYTDSLFTDL